MKHTFIFFFLFCLSPFRLHAVLAGSYTIGGINPDFATIKAAIDNLNNSGVSAPVVFKIRDGVYNENIPRIWYRNFSVDSITFQSESLDSSAVIITNNNIASSHTFSITSGYYYFKALTVTKPAGWSFSSGASILGIYNCAVMNGISSYGFGLILKNNHIEGQVNHSTGRKNPVIIQDNYIIGPLTINKNPDFICQRNRVIGNINLSGYVEGNHFTSQTVMLSYDSCIYKNNLFDFAGFTGVFTISFATSVQLINNEIHHRIVFSFTHSKVIGNKFFSDLILAQCDDVLMINNFFFKNIDFDSNHSTFCFNNCVADSGNYLINRGSYNIIKNNNMPWGFYGNLNSTTLHNNNYPVSSNGAMYDSHPYRIETHYKSPDDLHSTNLQLAAKGIPLSGLLFDIDSAIRNVPPSIGANEICIESDTIAIFCGDSVSLSLFSMPATGNFSWNPVVGLNNSRISIPTVCIQTSALYTVTDSISGYMDSVFVKVIPFYVRIDPIDPIRIQCGDHLVLSATYNAGAIYQWLPTDSLSSPGTYFTEAFPSQSTNYQLTASVSGCGTSIDSIRVPVDPRASAVFYYLDSCLTVSFFNYSTCATDFFWDFGDSTFSMNLNPRHTYAIQGSYQVSLRASNFFGPDLITGIIYADSCTATFLVENHLENLKFYPNPATNFITISFPYPLINGHLKIFNLLGELELVSLFDEKEKVIDVSTLPGGVHILEISDHKTLTRKKFIKQE